MRAPLSAIEALKLFWEMEEPNAPSQILEKTQECPSCGQFEAHIKGKTKLSRTQLVHIKQCHYCQVSIEAFERELKQWALMDMIPIGKHFARIYGRVQSLNPSESFIEWWTNRVQEPPPDWLFGKVPNVEKTAVIIDATGHKLETSIFINDGPYLTDRNHLRMRVTLENLQLDEHQTPVKVSLEFRPEDDDPILLSEAMELREFVRKMVETDSPLPPEILEREWFPKVSMSQPLTSLPIVFILHVEGEIDEIPEAVLEGKSTQTLEVEIGSLVA